MPPRTRVANVTPYLRPPNYNPNPVTKIAPSVMSSQHRPRPENRQDSGELPPHAEGGPPRIGLIQPAQAAVRFPDAITPSSCCHVGPCRMPLASSLCLPFPAAWASPAAPLPRTRMFGPKGQKTSLTQDFFPPLIYSESLFLLPLHKILHIFPVSTPF